MIYTNGYSQRSPMSLIFAFVDGVMVVMGVLMGTIFGFGGFENDIFQVEHLEWKSILIVFVIQTVFYYFDLYEVRNFRGGIKTVILFIGAIAVSSIFLAIIYYLVPFLVVGRGFFTIGLTLTFLMAFLLRLLYFCVANKNIFKERILIIGSGDLAQKIQKEIQKNAENSFEIVGFVDERRDKVGESI